MLGFGKHKKGLQRVEAVVDVFKEQINELKIGADEINSEQTENTQTLEDARTEFKEREKTLLENGVELTSSQNMATTLLKNLEALLGVGVEDENPKPQTDPA